MTCHRVAPCCWALCRAACCALKSLCFSLISTYGTEPRLPPTPPYPEELKPDEFMAALELLWAVLGLLAWRALPGDEGLLEFPGEHDDVTARQREQSEAGISPFCPSPSSLLLPPCAGVPSFGCLVCSSQTSAPQWGYHGGVSTPGKLSMALFQPRERFCSSHPSDNTMLGYFPRIIMARKPSGLRARAEEGVKEWE